MICHVLYSILLYLYYIIHIAWCSCHVRYNTWYSSLSRHKSLSCSQVAQWGLRWAPSSERGQFGACYFPLIGTTCCWFQCSERDGKGWSHAKRSSQLSRLLGTRLSGGWSQWKYKLYTYLVLPTKVVDQVWNRILTGLDYLLRIVEMLVDDGECVVHHLFKEAGRHITKQVGTNLLLLLLLLYIVSVLFSLLQCTMSSLV